MFWPDIIEVRHFYHTTLGQLVCNRLKKTIIGLWPELKNEVVLGVGYSFPYLRLFDSIASQNQLIAVSPTNMGVRHWPDEHCNKTVVAEEVDLPLPNNSVNAILLMHALEYSDQPDVLLQELWRVLVPGGRILVMVPHRRSLWSHMDNTPFGHGHPFTSRQIKSLLGDSCFVTLRIKPALFFPPTSSHTMLRTIPIWENIGQYMLRAVGGVLCVEAEKQIYALKGDKKRVRSGSVYVPVPKTVTPYS